MDLVHSLKSEKIKKGKLKDLLYHQVEIDKFGLKKFLLENYFLIPQEDRLNCWKIVLGNLNLF
jgi:hypothetical protein